MSDNFGCICFDIHHFQFTLSYQNPAVEDTSSCESSLTNATANIKIIVVLCNFDAYITLM